VAGGFLEPELGALYCCCWPTVGTDNVTTGWIEDLAGCGCDGGVCADVACCCCCWTGVGDKSASNWTAVLVDEDPVHVDAFADTTVAVPVTAGIIPFGGCCNTTCFGGGGGGGSGGGGGGRDRDPAPPVTAPDEADPVTAATATAAAAFCAATFKSIICCWW